MSQSGLQFRYILIGPGNIEERDKDGCKADPERTIGGEREGTESVTCGELPHPSTKLRQTPVPESYTNQRQNLGRTIYQDQSRCWEQ